LVLLNSSGTRQYELPHTLKRNSQVRNLIMVAAAAALTTTSFIVPVSQAEARHRVGEWRGNDGKLHCRKQNGTIGLVVGGVGGALVGRSIDTKGDRTIGTVIGAGAGALLGREIARGPRCR
jgi:hypothetical protein